MAKKVQAQKKAARKVAAKKVLARKKVNTTVRTAAAKAVTGGTTAPKGKVPALAPGMQWVNPYICVTNPAASIKFYEKAFGFTTKYTLQMPDGTIGHAELAHKTGTIMLGPQCTEKNWVPPTPQTGISTGLVVYVEDVDAVTARARSAGATVKEEPSDRPWGDRMSTLVDPDGHYWCLATHVKTMTPQEIAEACASACATEKTTAAAQG